MRKAYLLLTSILCLAGAAQASVTVTVNGSNYTLPQKNEKGWGDSVTSWMQAISANTLQPSGGLFSLSADIDLGPLAGVKSLYFKSRSNNIAASGQWRLANTDSIAFRNALNTGDLLLSPGGSDGQLNYNGVLLDTISGANTLTNKKLSDSTLSIVNVTDATKTLGFSLSGNATGMGLTLAPSQSTSQSLAIPNVSAGDALVTNNTTATLVSKTISGSSNTLSNIPNTATTAVSTNTANAIVARDASGNFSAGTITASLSGNATSANTATTAGNVTGTVAITNGGTGQTSASAAFNALAPTTTNGDLIVRSAGSNTRLGVGSSGQVLKVVGGAPTWATFSGGINYMSANPDAESDTSGYTVSQNTVAGASPDSGFVTTGPTITWTRTTTNPLRGTGSFLLTKPASNAQGQQVYYPFTIDPADQAKVLNVSFDYSVVSGTYADADLTIWIYDVTNAKFIQPAGYKILSAATGLPVKQVNTTFQTASNSTSYRVLIHVASTSAAAYSLSFDNFAVSPQIITQGTPVTDPVQYTMTIGGSTSAPSKASSPTQDAAFWHREGKYMVIDYSYFQQSTTGTAAGSGVYLFPIPSGYSVDTSYIYQQSDQNVGSTVGKAHTYDSANNSATGDVVVWNTGNLAINFTNTANGQTTAMGSSYRALNGAATLSFSFTAKVPIVGWSSQTQMSSDTSTRVIAATVTTVTGQAISNTPTQVQFNTVVGDSAAAYSTSTYNYTVPVPGWYSVNGAVSLAGTTSQLTGDVYLYKNGSAILRGQMGLAGNSGGYNPYMPYSFQSYFNAGDTIAIYADCSSASSLNTNTPASTILNITRISGPSQIAASEKIRATYNNSAGVTIPNGAVWTVVNYGTKEVDTHGAVTTGASWHFTAPSPMSGKIIAHDVFQTVSGQSGNQIVMKVYKNGNPYKTLRTYTVQTAGSINADVSGSAPFEAVAGDSFDIRISQNLTGGITTTTAAEDNFVHVATDGGN